MAQRIILTLVLIVLVALGATSCGTIETGNVGVRTTLGKVAQDEIEPGLYLGIPGISRVQEFSGKEIAIDLNDLTPKARDNLSLRDMDISVFYRAESTAIADLFAKYANQSARLEDRSGSGHVSLFDVKPGRS